MTALLNASKDDRGKFLYGLKSIKNLDIEIRPPQISKLVEECTVEGPNIIRLGTSICKNLKSSGSYAVAAAKTHSKTLFEFISKVNRTKLNVRACKAMVSAGILDEYTYFEGFQLNRTALRKLIEDYYEWFKLNETKKEQWDKWNERRETREKQEILKSQGLEYGKRLASVGKEPELPTPPNPSEYVSIPDDIFENALSEYEILGCTIGPMPTEFFRRDNSVKTINQLKDYLLDNFDGEENLSHRCNVIGIIAQSDEIRTSSQKSMATLLVEDETDAITITLFPRVYESIKAKIGKFKNLSCYLFDITGRIGYTQNSEEPEITFIFNNYSVPIKDNSKLRMFSYDLSSKIDFQNANELISFLESNESFIGQIQYHRLKGYRRYVRKDSDYQ